MLLDLTNYPEKEATSKCYLDGRYFNIIFKNYPGLVEHALYINIDISQNSINQEISFNGYLKPYINPNIVRVVIETQKSKHSAVLIIDTENQKGYYFDCAMKTDKNFIINILETLFNLNVELIDHLIHNEVNTKCGKSGFCVAYTIKFIYDYLLQLYGYTYDNLYNFNDIMKFVSHIEDTYIDEYSSLDPNDIDEEYGTIGGTFLGALGGGLIGGVVAGAPGALVGASLGGLGGYALSSYYDPYSYY